MNNTARIATGITTLFSGSALLLAPLTVNADVPDAPIELSVDKAAVCEHVTGEFVFSSLEFTSETTAVGVGTQTGDFPGTFHADYSNIRQGPGGPIKMDATHTLTTSEEDTLLTSDEILLIPQAEPGVVRANSRLHIVGGTGEFEGATGLLHTSGTVNMETLEGAIGFKGKICYASSALIRVVSDTNRRSSTVERLAGAYRIPPATGLTDVSSVATSLDDAPGRLARELGGGAVVSRLGSGYGQEQGR